MSGGRFLLLVFGLLNLVSPESRAQSALSTGLDSLKFWGEVMVNSSTPAYRKIAAEEVGRHLESTLASGKLDSAVQIPGIIALRPSDLSFTLYTWQFESESGLWNYRGLVQDKDGLLVKLKNEKRDYLKIRRDPFDQDRWYGALYYQISSGTYGKSEPYYVLLGFAQNNRREKFKIIEALRIRDGKVVFGFDDLMIEENKDEEFAASRQIIRYSPEASCAVNFEDNQIIYDHITRVEDARSDGPALYVPDGTYEALEYKGGKWKHIRQLENTLLKEPPREKPILDNRPKDLFGRPGK